jgi:hypothetical protein
MIKRLKRIRFEWGFTSKKYKKSSLLGEIGILVSPHGTYYVNERKYFRFVLIPML